MSTQNRIFSSIILLTSIIFIAATSSAYTITPLDEPYSQDFVGNLSDSSRMVNLTNNGEPVNEEDISDGFDFTYTYNASSGEDAAMQHLSEGYWYADINPDTSRGKELNYTLKETTGTEDEFFNTETLKFGNYSVELLSDTGNTLPPGDTVNVRVNVTDEWNDEPEEGANVNVYFTNGTETHKIQELGNQDGSEYYNSEVNVPDVYGAKYLMHVNVSNTGDSVENSNGSYTLPIETSPAMEGEIEELESSGQCNNSSFFTECEREAEISTSYNVTGDTPNSVNLTLNVWNRSNSSWQNHTVKKMEENNDLYQSDLTLPDLNTTAFGEEVQLVYNATGPERDAVEKRNITVRTYDISFGASSSVQQGGNYNLEVAFGKYFSSKPLDLNRINANITVGNSTENLTEFTLEEMDYQDGVFERDVEIGSDWEEGTYTVNVYAEDLYRDEKTGSENFFVEEVDVTFNTSGDIEDTIRVGRNYSYNFTVENLQSSQLELDAEYSDELEGITWVNGSDTLTVPADTEMNVTAKFNMTEIVGRDGEITLTDGAYNNSVNVDLDIPECDYRNGTVCVEVLSDMNVTADENGDIERGIRLNYLAPENSSEGFDPGVTGNISEYVSFSTESLEFNATSNEEVIDVIYTVSGPGYFTGTVQIGEVEIPVELSSDAESQNLEFSVTSSIDLGTLTEGETAEEDIEVENTASVAIDSVTFESDQMAVEAGTVELESGESQEVELSLSEISSSGSIQVTAESSEDESVQEIEVNANVIPDYSEQASSLRDRINSLQSQVSNNENQNKLNTASLNVTEVENAYQAEDYERAERIYEATEAEVSLVESRMNSNQGSTTDPARDPSSGSPSTGTSSDGSSMLPIIAGVVFLLLIIGFIAYTSLIPEEGDPLYKVLGR